MKKIDESGYWILKANPISRVGVFEYLGSQIDLDGKMGLDKNRRYGVLRPASELFDPEAMESMEGIPFIDDHEMLGDDFTPVEKRPSHGTVTRVRQSMDEPDVLIADIKIYTKTLKDKIEKGKKGLSLGYYCEYVPEVGVYKGKTYDFVQKTLRGNHLALVDRPRNGVYVQDSAISVVPVKVQAAPLCRGPVMAIDSAIEEIPPMKNDNNNGQGAGEKPEAQLMKLLTGQDADACKATFDFLQDYLAKRDANGGQNGQPSSDDNNGTPPPPPNNDGGNANPDGGNANPDGGNANPDGGNANPDGGNANPDGGNANPDGGNANPDGGNANPDGKPNGQDGGNANPDGGNANPDGGNANPDGGNANPDGKPNGQDGGCGGKGKGCAQDEAIRKDYFRKFAAAQELATKVSNLTGTFDSAEMSEEEVAVYGCKKLGIAFDEANPTSAVFAIKGALKFAQAKPAATPTLDSDVPAKSSEPSDTQRCVEAYFGK